MHCKAASCLNHKCGSHQPLPIFVYRHSCFFSSPIAGASHEHFRRFFSFDCTTHQQSIPYHSSRIPNVPWQRDIEHIFLMEHFLHRSIGSAVYFVFPRRCYPFLETRAKFDRITGVVTTLLFLQCRAGSSVFPITPRFSRSPISLLSLLIIDAISFR